MIPQTGRLKHGIVYVLLPIQHAPFQTAILYPMTDTHIQILLAALAAAFFSILITWLVLKNKHQAAMQAAREQHQSEQDLDVGVGHGIKNGRLKRRMWNG